VDGRRVRHDDAVDQDTRHADVLRRGRLVQEPAHLGNRDPARVVRRLGNRQHLAEDRLFGHHQVSLGVGGRRPDQADIDRHGLVPEPGAAVQLDSLHEPRRGAVVEPAAAMGGIDEGIEADVGDTPWTPRGDVAKQLADHALGKIVGLDLAFDGQPAHPRRQPPMASHDALYEALVGQVVHAPRVAVALARGVDDGQLARRVRGEEPVLQRTGERLRDAGADEPPRGHRLAVANQSEGLFDGTEFLVARRGHPHHPPLT